MILQTPEAIAVLKFQLSQPERCCSQEGEEIIGVSTILGCINQRFLHLHAHRLMTESGYILNATEYE